MDAAVEKVDGEFVIPLDGFVCFDVRDGHELILRGPGRDEAWLWATRLEEEAIQLLVEHKARVQRAVAAADSTLRIDFDDGFSLVNPPEEEVEAWEVRGSGYVVAVAVPGGAEPAIWDETSEIRVVRPGDRLPQPLLELFRSYGLEPAGEFELRCAKDGPAFELHPPDAPPLNRREIVRLVAPKKRKRWFR